MPVRRSLMMEEIPGNEGRLSSYEDIQVRRIQTLKERLTLAVYLTTNDAEEIVGFMVDSVPELQ